MEINLEPIILPKQTRVRKKKSGDEVYVDAEILASIGGRIPVLKSWAIKNGLADGEGLPPVELSVLTMEEMT